MSAGTDKPKIIHYGIPPLKWNDLACGISVDEMVLRGEAWMGELNHDAYPVTCPECRERYQFLFLADQRIRPWPLYR